MSDLEKMNNDVLKNLRLKKIEWNAGYADDSRIKSCRITLSDGSTSQKIGIDPLNN